MVIIIFKNLLNVAAGCVLDGASCFSFWMSLVNNFQMTPPHILLLLNFFFDIYDPVFTDF